MLLMHLQYNEKPLQNTLFTPSHRKLHLLNQFMYLGESLPPPSRVRDYLGLVNDKNSQSKIKFLQLDLKNSFFTLANKSRFAVLNVVM